MRRLGLDQSRFTHLLLDEGRGPIWYFIFVVVVAGEGRRDAQCLWIINILHMHGQTWGTYRIAHQGIEAGG